MPPCTRTHTTIHQQCTGSTETVAYLNFRDHELIVWRVNLHFLVKLLIELQFPRLRHITTLNSGKQIQYQHAVAYSYVPDLQVYALGRGTVNNDRCSTPHARVLPFSCNTTTMHHLSTAENTQDNARAYLSQVSRGRAWQQSDTGTVQE